MFKEDITLQKEGVGMKKLWIGLMFFAVLASSCTEQQKEMVHQVKGQFGAMFDLKAIIDNELQDGQSTFNIQNNYALTIRLVNTSYNNRSDEEREQKADALCQKVLDFIAEHQELDTIKVIYITYVKFEKKFMIVNITNTMDVYEYEIGDDADSQT